MSSVEVLLGDGTPWCTLPGLPEGRHQHSQTGLEACGGMNTPTTCVRFSGGSWIPSHELEQERFRHSSWDSPLGTLLIGGSSSHQTTELLDDDTSDSVIHFSLKYETWYKLDKSFIDCIHEMYINDNDHITQASMQHSNE